MNKHYPPVLVDATPDEVLMILRDQHRQQCTHDPEADWSIDLCRESTIADWREACDLVSWIPLAEAININWQISLPLEQWRAVLEPAKDRSLAGVCDLIAAHAKVPRVRPMRIMGRDCLPAGVFLTVRFILASAGANVSDLVPSTPLTRYTRRYTSVFLGPISLLAPGALPLVKIRSPLGEGCTLAFVVSWILIGVSHLAGLNLVEVFAVVAVGISWVGILIASYRKFPASVDFGRLATFRDLSIVIAANARN